jgi:uncharacterized protein (TIGR02598 family)
MNAQFAPKLHAPARGYRGFSLVEVMIAVGIVASVMLGLIGVMPVGLSAIQEAQHNSIKARIVQEVISDAQSANWNETITAATKDTLNLQKSLLGEQNIRYYTNQGARVIPQAARVSNEPPPVITYAAYVEVAAGGDNPTLMTTQKANAYKYLKMLNIYVEYTPGGRKPDFKNPLRAKNITKFPFCLVNMGTSSANRTD